MILCFHTPQSTSTARRICVSGGKRGQSVSSYGQGSNCQHGIMLLRKEITSNVRALQDAALFKASKRTARPACARIRCRRSDALGFVSESSKGLINTSGANAVKSGQIETSRTRDFGEVRSTWKMPGIVSATEKLRAFFACRVIVMNARLRKHEQAHRS